MKTESNRFNRLHSTTLELDKAELLWWERFAEVEERFCWVQTSFIQRFLRGKYLRRIIETESKIARIAELGCGTGWLSILLAQMGAKWVTGIDFSESQIRIATKRAKEAGIDGKVDFLLSDASSIPKFSQRFDVVVIHGFLHHLTTMEICTIIETVQEMLVDSGRLIIFEPVLYFSSEPTSRARRLTKYQDWMESIPSRIQLWGLPKPSNEEKVMRDLITKRNVGKSPRGPSPKEMPFAPDELPTLISPYFQIKERHRCMARSHLVAQEILLLELSHPWLARLLLLPLLFAARQIDQRILALENPPSSMWIFEMFECVPSRKIEEHT